MREREGGSDRGRGRGREGGRDIGRGECRDGLIESKGQSYRERKMIKGRERQTELYLYDKIPN